MDVWTRPGLFPEEERAVLALEDQSSDAVGGGAAVSTAAASQGLTVGGDSVALDHLGPIVMKFKLKQAKIV